MGKGRAMDLGAVGPDPALEIKTRLEQIRLIRPHKNIAEFININL